MSADVSNDLGNFAMIPVDVLRDPALNRNAKMLYAFLWDYAARATNMSHPSRKTLAQDMGSSLDTIDAALKQLRDAGVLDVVPRYTEAGDRTSNGYRLIFRQGGRKSGVTPYTSPAATVAAPQVEEQEPLKPEPIEQELPRKRGSRVSRDFKADAGMHAWAREHAPAVNVDVETDSFVDYWIARADKGAVKVDWVATWRNHMRRAQQFAVRNGWKPASGVPSRDATAETLAEQKQRWLDEHGVTEAEFEANKHDASWVRSVAARVAS